MFASAVIMSVFSLSTSCVFRSSAFSFLSPTLAPVGLQLDWIGNNSVNNNNIDNTIK